MNINQEEFKAFNKRLQESLTFSDLFTALKKPLQQILEDTEISKIETFFKEEYFNKKHPDKRITAQWLSTALAGEDYNKLIARLKASNEEGLALNIPNLETIDFKTLESSLLDMVKARYDKRVLYSELEIWLSAARVIQLIFGENKWTDHVAMRCMYDQSSQVKEIDDNEVIYYIGEKELRRHEESYICVFYEFKKKNQDKAEPSDDEIEDKDLEYCTALQLQQRFAWNVRNNCPAYQHIGNEKVLIPV